jgi:cytochrome d ubiquinol oxidase subunit I
MIGIGTAIVLLGPWGLFLRWRRRDIARAGWFLRATALSGIGAVVALEAGWIVTEVGRQPWIVYGYLRTTEAVTRTPGVQVSFLAVVALYTTLGVATLVVLRTLQRRWAVEDADAGGRAA